MDNTMGWNTIIGQERVKNLLRRSIERGQLAHAYLFYGIRGVGKQATAIEFARTILCLSSKSEACGECASCRKTALLQHPDLSLIIPLPVGKGEKTGDDPINSLEEDQIQTIRQQIALKSENPYYEIQIPKSNFIKINSVRNLKRISSLTSVEGSWKIFLICDADKMNAEASNSLLKTLEEPGDKTLLVLTTSEKDRLLPTIISRCQLVQFSPLTDQEIATALQEREHVPPDESMLAAKIAQGSYVVASELLSENLSAERKEVLDFIRVSLGWKEISRVDLIDELASSKDRNSIEHWLNVLQSWLRDAMVLRDARDSMALGAANDKEMQSFVQKFPKANIEQAIHSVETCIALVRKNVYLHLLLTTLSFDLKRTLAESIS
jgi:DNA polymerase III, delta'' subunit